jgi:hypothetical protein
MRKFFMTAFVLTAMLVLATSGLALEKSTAQLNDARGNDGWAAGTTCSVSYYNTCTGWLWVWSGWSPTDIVGMTLDSCCPANNASTLVATNLYCWSGAPTGYGFTGTVSVSSSAAGCPAGVLASQSLLPASGNNVNLWGLPADDQLVVTFQHANSVLPDPIAWGSDHPAAGPTGPASCGSCFPSTRTIHSFYYGNATTALCPGSSLNDGVCDAEWLLWAASFSCEPVVSVDDASWGSVKNLYR